MALPTEAYCSVEIVSSEGNIIKNFVHIPSTVEAFEPEEVGVEHLLREIKDISLDSLSNKVWDWWKLMKKLFVFKKGSEKIEFSERITWKIEDYKELYGRNSSG